jgi:D-alanyl-lipoteichoic acid acyltransferase DltB (MBOAT superfamily)
MLFNSLEYFIFFIVCLIVAWRLTGFPRIRIWFLLLASLYFYYSNNHWQILLLLFATTVDYVVSLRMQREREQARRRFLLCISVVSNLGLLCYFKYINFLADTAATMAAAVGLKLDWVDLNVVLPVGISFYTFEALSYTIDVYRGKIPAERRWSRLAFLVSFFPHLIAGPIVRAAAFFPQMDRPPRLPRERLEQGLFLISTGLFKKMLLADTLAIFADRAFDSTHSVGSLGAWVGVYAFSFQIYFDFNGYTDIALGSALLLGFELPQNFNRPYVAVSITEFWRRWHMTLSSWLRDYLYIPLGGNRMRSRWGVYRNLILTMFLGGLWHGAAWHFALWGVLHGLLLAVERALGLRSPSATAGGTAAPGVAERLLKGALTFQVVTFLWIPFRAKTLDDAWALLTSMFAFDTTTVVTQGLVVAAAVILLSWLCQALAELTLIEERLMRLPLPVKAVCYSAVTVGVLIASSAAPKSFIYFQF